MTDSRDFKRLVRKRMAETGETYLVARSHFDAPPKTPSKREAHERGLPTTVAGFKKKVYGRTRTKDLAAHIEQRYGVRVSGVTRLDVGVYRVDRSGEPSWVARLFPAVRTIEAARGDVEVLAYLESHGFPAERNACPDPLSMLAGQPVLVTSYAAGTNRRSDESERTMRSLGSMLGRLHSLPEGPGACTRDAGSWHHVSVNGGRRHSDVEILLRLFDDAASRLADDDRSLLDELRNELRALDDMEDLPHALIHPDPCGANLVAPDGGEGVLVDWTGVGRGARLGSFANLVGSVTALDLVDAAIAGYRRHVSLEPRELGRLEAALIAFPLVLDSWTVLFRDEPVSMLMRRLDVHRQRAAAIAARVRSAFDLPAEPTDADRSIDNQSSLF